MSLADYSFDNGWKESKGNQIDLASEGGTEWDNGKIHLRAINDGAAVVLSRMGEDSLDGLALNLRFLVEEYLGRENVSNPLLSVSLPDHAGAQITLQEPRWGAGLPTVFVGNGEHLAPPGVIAHALATRVWQDLWLVLEEERCRLWLNGDPVYHTELTNALEPWERFGEEEAELWVGGFAGSVDHVRIWEKR